MVKLMKGESNTLNPTKVRHYKSIKSLVVKKGNNNEERTVKLTYPSEWQVNKDYERDKFQIVYLEARWTQPILQHSLKAYKNFLLPLDMV